ncbi:hypothetical protein N473_21285 [Pseudoalteromonas luteoviolacea CPMOR-1]|uniref:Uncharacterized protein n=1 Tax=Pseudoalteromonas luteoviolacea CPMOR-1 TaxID=1365248 RepID=A0A162AN19_9GAMM|nr:hypothetical protein N473_21285 [Pseudoalteromonas luteoviolacea CPMOR-1]
MIKKQAFVFWNLPHTALLFLSIWGVSQTILACLMIERFYGCSYDCDFYVPQKIVFFLAIICFISLIFSFIFAFFSAFKTQQPIVHKVLFLSYLAVVCQVYYIASL